MVLIMPVLKTTKARTIISHLPAIIAAIFAIIIFYNYFTTKAPDGELGSYSLIRVLNRVEGIDTPSLHINEQLSLQTEICIKSKNPVLVETRASFYKLSESSQILAYELPIVVQQRRDPGCNTVTARATIPHVLTPGSYILKGTETLIATGQTQEWSTEPFRVVQ